MQYSQQFLALLNARKVTEKHWASVLPLSERRSGMWPGLPELASGARTILSAYLSIWIESGFRFPNDGKAKAEGERELSPMPSWAMAHGQTFGEEPERRNYDSEGCQEIFKEIAKLLNCTLHLAGPTPQAVILQANFQESSHPRGILSILFNPRGGVEASPGLVRGSRTQNELAAWGFFLFWKSPWLFTLMRCAKCGIFAIPQRKPRKHYKRGWHCEKCRNIAGALAATKASRQARKTQVFEHAVVALLKFEKVPRRSTHDRKQFIKEDVNGRVPYEWRIKPNWITRNLPEIQAEAERRKQNAKG